MKFTVELEEFWLEDEELESTLRKYVRDDVLCQVQKRIEDKIDKEITSQLTQTIEGRLEEITIKKHIENLFNNHHGWNSPNEKMKQIAKSFGKELTARYDKVFATHIVMGLKDQGLLKDEVAQILLEGKP